MLQLSSTRKALKETVKLLTICYCIIYIEKRKHPEMQYEKCQLDMQNQSHQIEVCRCKMHLKDATLKS